MFKTFTRKIGAMVGAVALGFTGATAAVDLTAVQTEMTAGQGQIEGFAPIVIGFILVMVVVGAIIRLVRKAG